MKLRHMVGLALAAAVLGSSMTTPANAAAAGAFSGEATVPKFGTLQATGGTFTGCANGVFNTVVADCDPTDPSTFNMTASFGYDESSAACPAVGTANGSTTVTEGANSYSATFAWTRVGATAVVTTTGPGDTGVFVAAFETASPPVPCDTVNGTSVTATVVGAGAAAP